MGFFKWALKMLISIAFDVADFFFGRVPVFGTVVDIAGTFLGGFLWGAAGLIQGLEIFDLTDQIDAFFPALTIAGLIRVKEIWED